MSGHAEQPQIGSPHQPAREEPEESSAQRRIISGHRRANTGHSRGPSSQSRTLSGTGSTPTGSRRRNQAGPSRGPVTRSQRARSTSDSQYRSWSSRSWRSRDSGGLSARAESDIRRIIREEVRGQRQELQPPPIPEQIVAKAEQGQDNQAVPGSIPSAQAIGQSTPRLTQGQVPPVMGSAPTPPVGQAVTPGVDLPKMLKKVKSLGCYPFVGRADPQASRDWLKVLLRAVKDMSYAEPERLLVASRLLEGTALTWWEGLVDRYPMGFSWDKFLEEFDRQYHAEYYRELKRQEFVDLRQGLRTVNEYEIAFRELSEFAKELVNTEKRTCTRFEQGLRLDIRDRITLPEEPKFYHVLEQAYRAEGLLNARQQRLERQRGKRVASTSPERANKRGRYTGGLSVHYADPMEAPGLLPTPTGTRGTPPPYTPRSSYQGSRPFCNACRSYHTGSCRGNMRCFNCNGTGHLRARCPYLQAGDRQLTPPTQTGPNRQTNSQRNTQGPPRTNTGNRGQQSTQHPGSKGRNQLATLDHAAQANTEVLTGTLCFTALKCYLFNASPLFMQHIHLYMTTTGVINSGG